MPNTIVVNVPPYEGEYEIDLNTRMFSHVEWRWVKKISGYMPMTISDGWKGGDPDLILALAIIAMFRSGKIEKSQALTVAEQIEDAEVDGVAISVKLEDDEEVVDDSPPAGNSESESNSSLSDSKSDSGESTSELSETSPEKRPSGTGEHGSDTTTPSDHLTLAT